MGDIFGIIILCIGCFVVFKEIFEYSANAIDTVSGKLISNKKRNISTKKQIVKKKVNDKFKQNLNSAKIFLRPASYEDNNYYTFANEFCIVKFYLKQMKIVYYDKASKKGYAIEIFKAFEVLNSHKFNIIFEKMCKQFTYDTKINDVIHIIRNTVGNIISEDNTISKQEIETLKHMYINNMSIAELITLPGINMGKANKIMKQLKKYKFKTTDEFISFAKVSPKNAKLLADIFKGRLRYKYKNQLK